LAAGLTVRIAPFEIVELILHKKKFAPSNKTSRIPKFSMPRGQKRINPTL
jgi:hypothetical protein